jgi:hypothetical protein
MKFLPVAICVAATLATFSDAAPPPGRNEDLKTLMKDGDKVDLRSKTRDDVLGQLDKKGKMKPEDRDRIGQDLDRLKKIQTDLAADDDDRPMVGGIRVGEAAAGLLLGNRTDDRRRRRERLEQSTAKFLETVADKKMKHRQVEKVESNGKEFRLETRVKNDGDRSRLRFYFRTKGVPGMRIRWFAGTDDDTSPSDAPAGKAFTSFSFRTAFFRLAETDETHTVMNSTNTFLFSQHSNKWSDIKYSMQTVDSVNYYQVSSSLVPGGSWGNLNITLVGFFAADVVPLADGNLLKPNGFKYSMVITGFPYSFTNGRMSLVKHLTTTSKDAVFSNATQTVDVKSGAGTLEWDGEVIADGTAKNVKINQFETTTEAVPEDDDNVANEASFRAVFEFPTRANAVVWDPEVSVSESIVSGETSGASEAALSSVALAVSMLAAVFVL